MKTTVLKKETTAMNDLGFAIDAFGALGAEILLMMLETALWGISGSKWTTLQSAVHWSLTCVLWGVSAFLLQRHIPRQRPEIKPLNLAAASLIMLASVLYTSFVWNGFKPAAELANIGLTKFVLQYLYYAFESMLILLIILFGQSAFEKLVNRRTNIPAGGVLLALTWGLVHILTQGFDTGVYSCLQACLFGLVYLALNKGILISYVAIALMFML